MSTFSTSLKLQLIGNGEQSGIWGSTTNSNWDLIEQAVSGVQVITMTNANYTLTNYNGVLDEARNMVLIVQGTNSAVYKVIAPLSQPKFYIVANQTVGGYAITVGSSTGAYVTIPNGTTALVYTNGTNFYAANTTSAGDFNVTSNLVVGGTTTLTGTLTTNAISATTIGGTTITASTQFSGPGTGLTGSAASLTAGNATVAATASSLTTSNWTVLESGGYLYFKYGGVNKMRLDSSGNLVCAGDVTASGTI